jgi:hypothetical protein
VPGIEALIISIAAAGICGMAALDRALPAEWTPPTRSYDELAAELGRWFTYAIRVGLGIAAVVGLATTLGFLAAAEWVVHRMTDAAFVIRPSALMFILLGVYAGMAAMMLFTRPIMRRKLKERYSDYWFVAQSLRRKRKSLRPPSAGDYRSQRRAVIIMGPFLAVLSLGFGCLMLDTYGYLTPSELVMNPLLGFRESRHPYSDVTSIDTYVSGRYHDQLECTIRFKDGSAFETASLLSNLGPAETRSLAAFVFERTRAPWRQER